MHKDRRAAAIQAAVAVADRLGLRSVTPVVLRDSNHTSIHLAPLPVLAARDKEFLISEHDRFRGLLTTTAAFMPTAIHGDPHLGNVLMTSNGPRWTDWESACVGPVEWDLACLPETALPSFPTVNAELLTVLRDLRSVCVAVWCWAEPDRAPEKREAAEYHLRRLREQSRAALNGRGHR